jgi:SAM-dependent methyltransferase
MQELDTNTSLSARRAARGPLPMFRTAVRYTANLVAMEARQEGYARAALAGGRFLAGEAAKLPKFARLRLARQAEPRTRPPRYSEDIVAGLGILGVEMKQYRIDVGEFHAHVAEAGYPKNYAAGPVDEGGAREKKLLEYFVSLHLMAVRPLEVVIDVASERSIFPDVLRRQAQATVYRQDLIYPPGIHGDRIGGSAAEMAVPDRFADKMVLHNSFEHFEGTADSDFVAEAWRVLRPGGLVCILPLFMSERHVIVTDPLVDREGIVWDEGADVVELPWHHNRFGRFYDPAALDRRVLSPAADVGFVPTLYHFVNVQEVHPRATMHFGLVLAKPAEGQQEPGDDARSEASRR